MCHLPSYQRGGVPAILNIMCMFIRHESEAQSLSPHYNKKVGKHFFHPFSSLPFCTTFISRMAGVLSPLLGKNFWTFLA